MSERLKLSTILLVLANLVPVAGVLLWDWNVFLLLLLFWCENVIIGFFGILKMFVSGSGVFLAAFFAVHYGGFMFGHVMVLFGMFRDTTGGPDAELSEPQVLLDVIVNQGALIPIVALFLSHGWSFVTNFLATDERNLLTGMQAMTMPYKRMVITHVALIAGGFALTALNEPLVGLLMLMVMKIWLDVVFHRREHSAI